MQGSKHTPVSRLWPCILLAAALLWLSGGLAFAVLPTGTAAGMAGAPLQGKGQPTDDGFEALPVGLKGISYSTLSHMGKVYRGAAAPARGSDWLSLFRPLLNIVWGIAMPTSLLTAGEPAAGMHPTNGNYALVSGNTTIDNTTDGGLTWQSRTPPNPSNYGDVVNAWLEPPGGNALVVSLNPIGPTTNYTCARSSDFGVTWATDEACGLSLSTTFFDDREYLWVDRTPSSPYYGRVYITGALFGTNGTLDYNTVTNRWSSDNGVTWNPPSDAPIALVRSDEMAAGVAHNEFPSLGISGDGTLGYAWHRGRCCTLITNVPNKVMFTRSTDGGVSFPFSTTIVTVPTNQSVEFNSISPLGVRWTDTPNIAADPTTNGVFYALWTQYRTPSVAASSAVYLSRTTNNGATWSTPIIPYNNPDPNLFQGWGWVKVTADHTVHLTYLGGTTGNMAVAQFYVQSTDGGATWTSPLQLSKTSFGRFGDTTDYESIDIGGPRVGTGWILATWAQDTHWARIGAFSQVADTPTPTATATATATTTGTSTPTFSATAAPPTGTATPLLTPSTTSTQVVPTPSPTVTTCALSFTDVQPSDYFNEAVQYLACRSILNGYNTTPPCSDTGIPCFKPYNNTTRAQMAKIVVLGFNKPIFTPPAGQYTFADTPPASAFWQYVETANYFHIAVGHLCGETGEPCDNAHRSYFRPNEYVTRGQLSKMVVAAAGWALINPPDYRFEDVLPGSTFYQYIETIYCRDIIAGYDCGSPGEPCDSQGRPYFRPQNNAIRGQAAKILYGSLTNPGECGAGR